MLNGEADEGDAVQIGMFLPVVLPRRLTVVELDGLLNANVHGSHAASRRLVVMIESEDTGSSPPSVETTDGDIHRSEQACTSARAKARGRRPNHSARNQSYAMVLMVSAQD